MSSTAQILANQKNAAASTGPRTEAGKAASSQNALKHGATAANVVLAFEDPAEFEAVRLDFHLQCLPATGLEYHYVDDLASLYWRLKRAERMVTCYTDREAYQHHSTDPMIAMSEVTLTPTVQRLLRYENGFRRAFESSWKRLKELQRPRMRQQEPNEA